MTLLGKWVIFCLVGCFVVVVVYKYSIMNIPEILKVTVSDNKVGKDQQLFLLVNYPIYLDS